MSNRKVINPSTIKGLIFSHGMQLNIKSIFKETCNGNCYKNGKILLIVASGGLEITRYSIKFVRVMFVIYTFLYIKLLGLYNNFAKT